MHVSQSVRCARAVVSAGCPLKHGSQGSAQRELCVGWGRPTSAAVGICEEERPRARVLRSFARRCTFSRFPRAYLYRLT